MCSPVSFNPPHGSSGPCLLLKMPPLLFVPRWLQSFYKRDYDDPYIKLALQGKVLRRKGSGYEVIQNV